MSELPGNSKKILFQPSHFLGNETESQRGQVSEFSPREPRPADSSTPSNTSPPSLSPHHQDPRCTLQHRPPAAGGSLGGWGGGRYDRGARREEALTWPDSRGLATDPLLHKQVLPWNCTHWKYPSHVSGRQPASISQDTMCVQASITQGDFSSLTLHLSLPYRDNLGITCAGRRGWAPSSASSRHILYQ